MLYLSDYMQKEQTKAFKAAGAFFAFSQEQFEKRKEARRVKYLNLGAGLIVPKKSIKDNSSISATAAWCS